MMTYNLQQFYLDGEILAKFSTKYIKEEIFYCKFPILKARKNNSNFFKEIICILRKFCHIRIL
jgi:hypothetical protein